MELNLKRTLTCIILTVLTTLSTRAQTLCVIDGTPLPDSVRFNWKEGFYDPQRVEELKQLGQKSAAERGTKRSGGRTKPPKGRSQNRRDPRTTSGRQQGNRKR